MVTRIFDGETFDPSLDELRLLTQLERVYLLMRDGKWRTLSEIAGKVEGSEAGCSARLRDLRKSRWGSHTIESDRLGGGTWKYRMLSGDRSLAPVHEPGKREPVKAVVARCEAVVVDGLQLVRLDGYDHYMADTLLAALRGEPFHGLKAASEEDQPWSQLSLC